MLVIMCFTCSEPPLEEDSPLLLLASYDTTSLSAPSQAFSSSCNNRPAHGIDNRSTNRQPAGTARAKLHVLA